MKRIVIVDHFSQTPDEVGNNRFLYLAQLLCNRNYRVEIITTDFSHKAKKTRQTDSEILKRLDYGYTMLPEPGYPKNVCLTRFYSHYSFGKQLAKYMKTMEKPDLVYAATPSLDAAGAAAKYCKRNHIPFVVDIQDLWPEAFKLVFNLPVISDLIFAPMQAQAKKIYRQASEIIAVSESYANVGKRYNEKVSRAYSIFLGTDIAEFDRKVCDNRIMKPEGEVWIAYAGTLGHSYNIEIILDALDLLPDDIRSRLVFKVLGDGPLMERFQKRAANCKVCVDFLGRVDYGKMAGYLSSADIAVNPIAKGAAQSIINKHADYAAAGLPVVSTQECPEYRKLLEDYRCGINCPPEDAQAVANALEQLLLDPQLRKQMGENSRKMAQDRFDRMHTYEEIVKIIERYVR